MTDHGLGATPLREGSCAFVVWGPLAELVEVEILEPAGRHALSRGDDGYHRGVLPGIGAGHRYFLRVDGGEPLPDPASRSQPDGVHGPSEVVDPSFDWSDADWRGVALEDLVIYELHVGTFTPEGTFEAVIPHLARLWELGVTALEIMPVASFPGTRNWGYDGVLPFAAQSSYGGPRGLQRLVDACHSHGLAVLLDVVYNHLGPEGNRLAVFGPYFTNTYATPWGDALNFDDPHSDGVRRYFVENAVQWVTDFHLDGLRLDAVQAILDRSARPFLEELAAAVHERGRELGRRVLVIGETDQNDPRMVKPVAAGGLGLDAIWCDDLHHALHVALTDQRDGYYRDFGALELLAAAWATGMAFTGQYSEYRHRRHGRPAGDVPPRSFVVCAQNHDQVGNRMLGERLSSLVSSEALRLAAAVVLLSPCTPLLFMGEEWGETRPFLYFTSHGDPDLADAVRQGRKAEFSAFAWKGEPPDPQDPGTFHQSVLHGAGTGPEAEALQDWYRRLLALRRELPVGADARVIAEDVLWAQRGAGEQAVHVLFHFGAGARAVELPVERDGTRYRVALDSLPDRSTVPDTVTGGQELRLFGHQALVFVRAFAPGEKLLTKSDRAQETDTEGPAAAQSRPRPD